MRLAPLVVMVCLFLSLAPASATECLDYEDLLHIVGGKNTLNDTDVILVEEDNADLAYLVTDGGASTGSYFVSLDISDPAAPQVLGVIECELKNALSLGSYDRYAYYGLGDAYPVGANGNVYVISVFTPGVPWIAHDFSVGSWPLDLLVSGQLLYVATESDGLGIFELSTPRYPSELSFTDLGGRAWSLARFGFFLYVGLSDGEGDSILVVDITDAGAPFVTGEIPAGDIVRDLMITDGHLYAAGSTGGLLAYDLTDPAAPLLVAQPSPGVNSVALDAYGDRLHSAGAGFGLQIFDLADPADPAPLASLRLHQEVWDLLATPTHSLLLGTDLISVDSSPAAAGSILGVAPLPDLPSDLALSGDIAYISTGSAGQVAGLQIYDVASPGNPVLLDSWSTGDEAFNIAVDGNTAYLSHLEIPRVENQVRITVLNVSDPGDAQPRGSLQFNGFKSTDLEATGEHLYLTDGMQSLRVIDVSDPDAPVQVGIYSGAPLSSPRDLDLHEDRVCVADGDGGVSIFDVSTPASPTLLGSYDALNGCNEVLVRGDLAYVATVEAGLVILDVSNPAAPALVGQSGQEVGMELLSLELGWSRIYATYNSGLQVFDVSDPYDPRMVGSLSVPGDGRASNLTLYRDMLLATLGEAGLGWLPLNCGELTAVPEPAPASLALDAWPNPFNPKVTLSFSLEAAARVSLTLHDVSGRRIRSLATGPFTAGDHSLVWDGLDEAGRPAPSGVYLARMDAGEASTSRKLTLLR